LRVLIVSSEAAFIENVRMSVHGLELLTSVASWQGDLASQTTLPDKGDIDLLIADCRIEPTETLNCLASLMPLYPGVVTSICMRNESSDLLMKAMRSGVQEVVNYPLDTKELRAMVVRVDQRRKVGARKLGKILSFVSCKGGSGATFLASNLAYALAEDGKSKVLLIDLNLQFGDAALFVSDKRPPATLADLSRDSQRLDTALLESSVVSVLPNFGVLASPGDPTQATEIRPAQIEALLRFCRNHVDYIVLDLGRSIDGLAVKALDLSDQIYPVVQLTLPFVRDAKRLLDLFRSLEYSKEKVRFIVNRLEMITSLTPSDLEQALSSKIFRSIPNHYRSVSESVNQGVPILKLHKSSPVSKALVEFAKQIQGDEAIPVASSWIDRLLKRSAKAQE
jgi:pilus assembly protein CpaE